EPAYLDDTRVVHLRGPDGRILAFANLHPTFRPGVARIDLLRHAPDAPNGTMEFLLLRVLERLHAEGHAALDFGLAPLTRVRDWDGAGCEEAALDTLQAALGGLFSFRG